MGTERSGAAGSGSSGRSGRLVVLASHGAAPCWPLLGRHGGAAGKRGSDRFRTRRRGRVLTVGPRRRSWLPCVTSGTRQLDFLNFAGSSTIWRFRRAARPSKLHSARFAWAGAGTVCRDAAAAPTSAGKSGTRSMGLAPVARRRGRRLRLQPCPCPLPPVLSRSAGAAGLRRLSSCSAGPGNWSTPSSKEADFRDRHRQPAPK